MTSQPRIWSEEIKKKALALGFDACGIAKAEPVDPEAVKAMEKWLEQGKQAEMHYLDRNRALRYDPSLLYEGCKSIIVVALNYYANPVFPPDVPVFARYAYGKDYHFIVKEKLALLLQYMQQLLPNPVNGRAFVDSAPIMERYWAWKAGLGWIGKHTQLILPRKGSFFFLGELLVDQELFPDQLLPRAYCGRCTRCIEACPTHALSPEGELDASKCLSYQTIENRGEIPAPLSGKLAGRTAYGCDICQNACPHNRFATTHSVPELEASPAFTSYTAEMWKQLDKPTFKRLFKHSAVQRAGFAKLKKNIDLFYDREQQEDLG